MSAMRGILVLFFTAVLVAGAALSLAQDMRIDRFGKIAALVAAQKAVADLRLRIAEMDSGPGQVSPSLPAIAAQDELDAELQFQDRLFDLGRQQGISPLSFGGAPMPVEVSHPAVAYSFEFETGHDQTMGYIEALEKLEPAIAVHGVWIRHLPVGSLGDTETPVSVRLTLWSFWTEQAEGQGG